MMKIGIVVYSQTGNTESVAKKVAEGLKAKGHEVDYLKVELHQKVEGSDPVTDANFKSMPKIGGYDAYVFGSFVEAFSLNRAMTYYLGQLDPVNAPAACLTTQGLMAPWMGANRTQRQMKQLLIGKGARILGSANVVWFKEDLREERSQQAVDAICALF